MSKKIIFFLNVLICSAQNNLIFLGGQSNAQGDCYEQNFFVANSSVFLGGISGNLSDCHEQFDYTQNNIFTGGHSSNISDCIEQSDNILNGNIFQGGISGNTVICYLQADLPQNNLFTGGLSGNQIQCYQQQDFFPNNTLFFGGISANQPNCKIQGDYLINNSIFGGFTSNFGFSCIGSVNDEVPLPVELLYFTAKPLKDKVELTWKTLNEWSADYFEIEKNFDDMYWLPISKTKAKGNSQTSSEYLSYDHSPIKGINYYRLKQVDLNGKIHLSSPVSVVFEMDIEPTPFLYPNPTNKKTGFYLFLPDNHLNENDFLLTDVVGKNLNALFAISKSDKNKFTFTPENNAAEGIYIISFSYKGKNYVYKILLHQ